MKKLLLLFIFAFSFSFVNAQSFSFSPFSMPGWGQARTFNSISFEYKSVGIHYFHADENAGLWDDAGEEFWGNYNSTFGISFIPIKIKDIVRVGTIYTFDELPTEKSNKLNFWFEVGYDFKSFRIAVVHVSNGFGLINEVNPGLDRLRITIDL